MKERQATSANSEAAAGTDIFAMQYGARDCSDWPEAFKREPSIPSGVIEDAMIGVAPLAFAIQQSVECPLWVISGHSAQGT